MEVSQENNEYRFHNSPILGENEGTEQSDEGPQVYV